MDVKQVKQAIDNFSKLSDEELMTQLAQYMAAEQAKDGGKSMMKTIERIKPFLNSDQKRRLETILKGLDIDGGN